MDTFIQRVAKEAGAAVLKRFGKDGVHYSKSDHVWDVVTKADLLAERIVISAIKKKYPKHGIISEESASYNADAEYVWIIDPIDGTMNFSRGVPMFGIMICLVRREEVLLSTINLPATREFFFAKKGKGAYLNGKRIRCSRKRELDNSFGSSSAVMNGRTARFFQNVIREGKRQRISVGTFAAMSVNACLVASGRRDWMVPLQGKIWDFAPTYLMLKEAGCKVTDTKGRPWKFGTLEMAAANPILHKELLRLTKNI